MSPQPSSARAPGLLARLCPRELHGLLPAPPPQSRRSHRPCGQRAARRLRDSGSGFRSSRDSTPASPLGGRVCGPGRAAPSGGPEAPVPLTASRGEFPHTRHAAGATSAHLAPPRPQARFWAAMGPWAAQTLCPSVSVRDDSEPKVRLLPEGICRLGGTSRATSRRTIPTDLPAAATVPRSGGPARGWVGRGCADCRWTFGDRDTARGRPAQPGKRMKGLGKSVRKCFSPI